MDRIAVLIPCCNEANTIAKVVADFKRALPEAVIYVYDNNSTDDTLAIAKEAGAVVRHERNQGKGNVIRRMFREIDAECYIIADGDDTYPAKHAVAMAKQVLEDGADMVVGDRLSSTYFTENKRKFHNFGNSLMLCGIRFLFKNKLQDIMTGYRALGYLFVKTFPVLSRGFEIETEMSIHAADKNMRVAHEAIGYRDRPAGSVSKLRTYSDGIKVLKTLFRLFRIYRPVAFFSALALVFFLLGFGPFIPVLIEYLETGLVLRFPTLIVSGFLMLAAIQALFGGLILDSIRQKARHDFEMRLLDVRDRYQGLLRKQ